MMDKTMILCLALRKCNRNLLAEKEWDKLQSIKRRLK